LEDDLAMHVGASESFSRRMALTGTYGGHPTAAIALHRLNEASLEQSIDPKWKRSL